MVDVSRFLQQTAVYWAAPVPDGFGGFNWDDPVEIKCRWTDSTQVITSTDGDELVSLAFVLVESDVQEQGRLFLGTLADLDSADEDDPTIVARAFVIKRFDKIPDISAASFLRKAFL